jgi:DNA polymerase-3 subunit epsilon
VGAQDLRRTLGRDKSSKHRKVEKLISDGCDIAIIGEEDFLELVGERPSENAT